MILRYSHNGWYAEPLILLVLMDFVKFVLVLMPLKYYWAKNNQSM